MIIPEITALYTGLFALMLIGMSVFVILARLKYKVALGDQGVEDIMRRNRIQGNFIEHALMIILLLFIIELNGYAGWIVHGLGLLAFISRISHAYALAVKDSPLIFRQAGMMGTFITLFIGAVLCIISFLF